MELDAAPGRIYHQPGLVAVLKGQFYDMDVQAMLRLYRQYGPAFARCLDGSFSLLLLDEAAGTVLAVTDRVGSHKLYALHDGQRVTVSTLPDHPDFTRRPYRPAGLASTHAFQPEGSTAVRTGNSGRPQALMRGPRPNCGRSLANCCAAPCAAAPPAYTDPFTCLSAAATTHAAS
ncbi:hypothetical protein GCM10010840_36180 [Deinococcus aerolatus]|uniref:Glutamine amidotransferase type-2 domain-containing protein n=1 Tax=Deinococcus aerolatus TaxID=522487 RepID=A0ABQ2GH41_9DEIO|nr:hypothetical protein [Deinococcus aerolatus]GGL94886.1 hypothetical protein GCM10010840_36180 [Deinococcus aerolatus]